MTTAVNCFLKTVVMGKLSEREWLVLGVLWDNGGATLGELTQALHQDTGWNRNTVLTYLPRMEAKGLVLCFYIPNREARVINIV